MHEITNDLAEKAEGDYELAEIALLSGRQRVNDGVCFHAQQCAEKYLKAYLYEHSRAFPKIHKLHELLDLCVSLDGSFETQRSTLTGLEPYAVEVRYLGLSADAEDAKTAFADLNSFRAFIRAKLGLS
jgi:HEPN domain-containing protein